MGGQSLLFYATLAWLAADYTSLGLSAAVAGLLLALFSAAQLVTALAMPSLAHRGGDLAAVDRVSVGLTTAGLAPGGRRARRVRRPRPGSGPRCSGSAWAATWRWR